MKSESAAQRQSWSPIPFPYAVLLIANIRLVQRVSAKFDILNGCQAMFAWLLNLPKV